MSVNGDVSEQVVRLSLEGFEVLAKLTGSGVKNIAAMLYAIMKDQNQTKGKARLKTMLKTGKPLKIFAVKNEDLKVFSEKAKKYGILYCALLDKNNKDSDGIVDIMVKEEDASRINRIVERFKINTVDTAKMMTEQSKTIESKEKPKEKLYIQDKNKEKNPENIMTEEITKKENKDDVNFNLAKTEKIPLSEHFSRISEKQDGVTKSGKKPSVRKELAKMKIEAQKNYEQKYKTMDNYRTTSTDELNKKAPINKRKNKGKYTFERK